MKNMDKEILSTRINLVTDNGLSVITWKFPECDDIIMITIGWEHDDVKVHITETIQRIPSDDRNLARYREYEREFIMGSDEYEDYIVRITDVKPNIKIATKFYSDDRSITVTMIQPGIQLL